MRAAVVFFTGNHDSQLRKLAGALVKGMEKQGAFVDLIDGERDVNTVLTIYDYISVGAGSATGMGGSVGKKVTQFLANAGIVTGKRSFAFVSNRGLRKAKTLSSLMKAMEFEGMYLKNSSILISEEDAERVGHELHLS